MTISPGTTWPTSTPPPGISRCWRCTASPSSLTSTPATASCGPSTPSPSSGCRSSSCTTGYAARPPRRRDVAAARADAGRMSRADAVPRLRVRAARNGPGSTDKGGIMRVFVAGAAGAIGQQLLPQLVAQGHQVTASTRSPAKAARLRELGAEPVVLDGLDAMAVGEAVARAEPEAVVHQMTSLAAGFDLRHFDRMFAVTNRLRTQGTDHLLAAAAAAGARRFIAQSYTGWPNVREGGPVKTEDDPLDPDPPAAQRETLAAIEYLERVVPAAPMEGIVLRHGSFYGPGASDAFVDLVRKRRLP